MSNAAILAEPNGTLGAEKSTLAARWLMLGGIIVLAMVMGGSLWTYLEGAEGLRKAGETRGLVGEAGSRMTGRDQVPFIVREINGWARQVSVATNAGCAGLMLVGILGGMAWRQLWQRRLHRQSRECVEANQRVRGLTEELDGQRGAKLRAERELAGVQAEIDKRVQERTEALAKAHAVLEKELNTRKQAERQMTQQAQELERSKDVLGLHVQARSLELQKLKSTYESILNSAGEGIYGLDGQGRINFVNPAAARITGWKVEELVGKNETEVFHRLATNPEPTRDPNGHAGADQVFYRKDNSSFLVEYMRTAIKEKEKDVGAVVIFKDITERKRAEEALNRKAAELARSNAELEQFAYVASHDLQEPLRKIQAFGDRLKTKCDEANLQDGRDYLERMQSAAARMQTLINDLLTFSRVISSQQPFVPVELKGLIKGVLGDLEVSIEQRKAVIELGELATIEADPTQMRQLFQNLIGNALKFQPPAQPPVVKIHSRIIKSPFAGTPEEDPYAEQCEISVQDNGIGFEEKYLDKIFAVFQRLHGRSEYEGTGVGLAVCRRITDRHGGIITARSQPGQGATFIATLPLRRHMQEVAP